MRCQGCEEPLPAPKPGRGRPRKFHNERCRETARRRRRRAEAPKSWQAFGPIASVPVDPVTRRARTLEALARVIEGAPPAAPEDQLAQALIETKTLAWQARRIAAELPPRLGLRAELLAAGIARAAAEAFPEFE